MKRASNNLIDGIVLLYPLLIAVFSGAVLLDIIYTRLLGSSINAPQAVAVYRGVSDALLQLGFLAVTSAIVSIALSWQHRTARNYFITSLAILIAFEFMLPVIIMPLANESQAFQSVGPWLRMMINFIAMAFGFVALRFYFQSTCSGSAIPQDPACKG